MKGLILLAHGARRKEWAAPFEALAASLAPHAEVELAFLELMEPDLPGAVQRLLDRGCARIDVLPCFLGGAGHVQRDVPPLLTQVQARHPGLQLRLHTALGEQAAMIEAMRQLCLQLLENSP